MIIYAEPMGAVRMTRRGRFVSKTAQKYLAYKTAVGYGLKQAWDKPPTEFACAVKVKFHMAMPKSWSMKKRREHIGKHVTVKPDIDNLVKGCFDAVNGIIWKDDNQVVRCEAEKVYAEVPAIQIEVMEVF